MITNTKESSVQTYVIKQILFSFKTKMLIIEGNTGTYKLETSGQKAGKFGKVMIGKRDEDQLHVIGKLIPPPTTTDEKKRLETIINIKHQNLAQTIEIIEHQEQFYLIREYYEGSSLKHIISKSNLRSKLSAKFFLKASCFLLEGLHDFHQNNLIHRDIKPSNIILRHTPDSNPMEWNPADVVLTDFEQSAIFPVNNRNRSPFALIYSPPEQLLNHNWLTCPATDLFSLAVSIYEMLSGKAPWVDCNAEILLNLQLTYPIKRPSGISEELFKVIAKAAYKESFPLPPKRLAPEVIESILIKGIDHRYQSALDMKSDLEHNIDTLQTITKHSIWDRLLSCRKD